MWLRLLLASGIVAVLPVGTALAAPDRTPPKLKAAVMKDTDHDGKADVLVLTFSERVVHRRDTDHRYPFAVAGYGLVSVGGASGKTIALKLVEKALPDGTAKPAVTYRQTKSKPVRDRAGNQAKRQTFHGTRPTGFVADPDGDGFLSPADCGPADPAIHPGATDLPEPAFTDANCDGIDGDKTLAIFVSLTGSNTAGCGAIASPCATIPVGLQEAVSQGKHQLYISAGTYPGAVALASGVDVYGGFSAGWARSVATTGANQVVTITGNLDGVTGKYLAVKAILLAAPAKLSDVRVNAPNAIGAGASSYGVVVQSSSLTLDRVIVNAGNGVNGAPGSNGTSASQSAAALGGTGGDGREYTTICDTSGRGAGGTAGANGSAGSRATGGVGGAGGLMDTDCGFTGACNVSGNCDATKGLAGLDAFFTQLGVAGIGGAGGPFLATGCDGTANPGVDGLPGLVVNGTGGTGGTASQLSGVFWVANAGAAGQLGLEGSGGGGGGGSAGCDDGTDAYGAGGGGGGAGGAKASLGGGGGGGGGGSFAVFAFMSTVTITNSTLQAGTAGDGGAGGQGGAGQPGGAGGPAGAHPGTAVPGHGGAGAHGGHSGGGGGGQGGYAFGVYSFSSAITRSAVTTNLGTPGSGGTAGPAGGAGGSAGGAGVVGTGGAIGTCASAGAC